MEGMPMDNFQHDYQTDRPLVGTDGTITAELPGAGRPSWAQAAWSTGLAAAALFVIALLLALLGGCEGRVSLFPNTDPELRKTPPEFAADAAKRFPYKANLPVTGEAAGRVSVDYGLDVLQITNISDEDWNNVELWINKKYVVFLPKVEKGAQSIKTLNFQMFFNEKGDSFPTDNIPLDNQVHTVELIRDGKLYAVRTQLAD
jgi:hypothetical protein